MIALIEIPGVQVGDSHERDHRIVREKGPDLDAFRDRHLRWLLSRNPLLFERALADIRRLRRSPVGNAAPRLASLVRNEHLVLFGRSSVRGPGAGLAP